MVMEYGKISILISNQKSCILCIERIRYPEQRVSWTFLSSRCREELLVFDFRRRCSKNIQKNQTEGSRFNYY